jgi:hypothetical protein
VFFWKKDTQQFAISPSNTGMPLEFRLGMREQQAEIDAIVLNLSSTLTGTELDGLFAFLPGDYNGDDHVDAADYVTWRKSFGQNVAHWSGADGSGDGIVDEVDFDVWKANFGSSLAGSGGAASSPIPEPTTLLLALVAMFACSSLRRNGGS